jgi:arsenate reductase (glutaredoxin)
MPLTVYHYPRCSTCKKALAWLDEQGAAYQAVDLVATPPTAAELERWWRASGKPLAAFFNTSGQSYRDGDFKHRLDTMTDAQKVAALAADGKLIKRPLLVRQQGASLKVAVGFREPEFAQTIK